MNNKAYIFFAAFFVLTTLFGFSLTAHADLNFDAALGLPSATVTNPDGSKANYGGLAVTGRLFFPIIDEGNFQWGVFGSTRYFDLRNTANNAGQKETSNQIGFGVGTEFQAGKFVLGVDYNMMKARHFFAGSQAIVRGVDYLEYDYAVMNLYLGLRLEISKELSLGVTYSSANGKVPKSATQASKDSPYTENTIWLHLTYKTSTKLGKVVKDIVK